MSGRMKKYRNKMGKQAISGKISVNQARARLGWVPLQVPPGRPGASVAKAAKPATVKVNARDQVLPDNPAAARARIARQVLAGAASEPRDPSLRENIRPGGGAG